MHRPAWRALLLGSVLMAGSIVIEEETDAENEAAFVEEVG